MELKQIAELINRWESLFDKSTSVNKLDSSIANCERYFKDILSTNNFNEVNDFLDKVEKIDKQVQIDFETNKVKEQIKKLEMTIKTALDDTTWSMLSDAPLSQEGKKLYRDYRQYLRDIPDLWKRKQINELKVMTFDEWRKNPPVYKVEKKVII